LARKLANALATLDRCVPGLRLGLDPVDVPLVAAGPAGMETGPASVEAAAALPAGDDAKITICGAAVARRLSTARFDAAILVDGPERSFLDAIAFEGPRPPLRRDLIFDDVDDRACGGRPPSVSQIAEAICFAQSAAEGHLMVCSLRGLGRAPALAVAIFADRLGPGREGQAVDRVYRLVPRATPNRLVIALADDLLDRRGALVAAATEREPTSRDAWAARGRIARAR
jgi:hypothetical protein